MNERKKILIALDGSAVSEAILRPIHPLIRRAEVETTLLHVAETSEAIQGLEARFAGPRIALEEKGVSTRLRIVAGKPADEILRQSDLGGFDLVAMATHGRTGLDRLMMGSVAEEVVRSSRAPALLCRPGTRIGEWDRIVVPVDGTPGSEEVLDDVASLARSLGAEVHLVRVGLGLLMSDGYRGVSYQFTHDDPTEYLRQIASRLSSQGVSAVAERRLGMAGVEIPSLARELDAGLICMTTEGRPEQVPGLDRSVAAEVIRAAPCPVYVRRMTGSPGRKETSVKRA